MGDEGGGVAVLGGDFDLLVDHGAFVLASRFLGFLPWRSDTIARKPEHDKAISPLRGQHRP
jgi:hypothetical protein